MRGLIVLSIIFVSEFLWWLLVKHLTRNFSEKKKKRLRWGYHLLNLLMLGMLLYPTLAGVLSTAGQPAIYYRAVALSYFISKLPILLFYPIAAILVLFKRLFNLQRREPEPGEGNPITRSQFLKVAAVGSYVLGQSTLLKGMIRGPYRFRTIEHEVFHTHLPPNADGLKVVHISDIHCGSWTLTHPFTAAMHMINNLQPDIICFSGDLVNFIAPEAYRFFDDLKLLKATHGIFCSLGNHDFGDYRWDTTKHPELQVEIDNHMRQMHEIYRKLGWVLLRNDSVTVTTIDERFRMAGCDNWSGNRIGQRYGDLDATMREVEPEDYTILLSHDPSHFNYKIVPSQYTPALTLAGHTHGMQFGIEWAWLKWSPVQYLYKYWAGLHKVEEQYLNVNRGLGFIGYPGRVGIDPEITLITLRSA